MLQCGLILTALMKGRLRIEPRTGILRIKPTTTGKKPLDVMRVGGGDREKLDYQIQGNSTKAAGVT